MASATNPCSVFADRLRRCLHERRSSGRKCDGPLKALEDCRSKFEKSKSLEGDKTRVLPPKKCRLLSCEVQACLRRNGVDESACQEPIAALKACLLAERGGSQLR